MACPAAVSRVVALLGPELNGIMGVLRQPHKKSGGIIKHNTNAVKNLAATQAFLGDNVDEGSIPGDPGQEVQAARQAGSWSAGPGPGRGGRVDAHVDESSYAGDW
eukprot:jgi/Tetstr1/437853/TSEL_026493.t1